MSTSLYSKEYWQAAFNSIFNSGTEAYANNPNELSEYFAPSYVQVTDGKNSKFDEFTHHLDVVRSHISKAEFVIHECVSDGTSVAWRHTAVMSMKDGGASEFEVFLIGQLDGKGRFERIVESTRQISGKQEDEDLGRRT